MRKRTGSFICVLLIVILCLSGCSETDKENSIEKQTEVEEEQEPIWEDPTAEELATDSAEKRQEEKAQEEKNSETMGTGASGETSTATPDEEDSHKVLNYDEISNKKFAWWFKRNETNSQPEAQQEVDIEQYDAWYVEPDQQEKVVYLTFDCGYENGFTPAMLDALKKHKAKGVFFITKHFAKDAADIVKRMKEEGHYVGNHTANHPDLTEMDTRSIKVELKECEEAVKEYTGYEMDMFFRPPKGEYSERVLKNAQDMGYKTLFWSLAYVDYDVNKQPGKDYVIEHYKKYIHPGAIPLIHNVSESNAQALDQVLTDLEGMGYRFGDPAEIGKPDTKAGKKGKTEKNKKSGKTDS